MLQGLVPRRSVGTGGLNTDRLQDQRGSDKAQERAQWVRANEEVQRKGGETHTSQAFSLKLLNYGRNSSFWRHKALWCVNSIVCFPQDSAEMLDRRILI